MARTETVVLTNMCMVTDGQGNVLVQDKISPGWSGLTYPGGHVEPGEAFTDSVIREVREETGLTLENPRLCGIKHFLMDDCTRYIVFLYRADRFTGQLRSSREGRVFWMPLTDFARHGWVPDFDLLRRVFEEDTISEMYYVRQDDAWETVLC